MFVAICGIHKEILIELFYKEQDQDYVRHMPDIEICKIKPFENI